MSDKEFIEQASIAAINAIAINNPELFHSDIAQRAVARAEALLSIIKGKNYSNDEEMSNAERIDNLEYAMDNFAMFLEHNCSAWINEPIPQQMDPKDKPN